MPSEYDSLTKRIEDHQELLRQERERRKPTPNTLMERETGARLSAFDFWCDNCLMDFSGPCHKTKHRLFGDTIAVWRARCPICDTDCLRHITHKDDDKYYNKSTKVRRQRNEYAWQILQAGEHGFRTHYGNPYKEHDEKMQTKEKNIVETERAIGLKGLSLREQQRLRRFRNSL